VIHHTRTEDVRLYGTARLGPLPVLISIIPLLDIRHALPDGTLLAARLDYSQALEIADLLGGRLPTKAEIEALRTYGKQIVPYLGTPTAENDIMHSVLHDANMWTQLRAPGAWDNITPVCGFGKHWIHVPGMPSDKSALMGWDKDGPGPGLAWWQPPSIAHNRKHFDDGTTTEIVFDITDEAA
jgi:hypothetical protein